MAEAILLTMGGLLVAGGLGWRMLREHPLRYTLGLVEGGGEMVSMSVLAATAWATPPTPCTIATRTARSGRWSCATMARAVGEKVGYCLINISAPSATISATPLRQPSRWAPLFSNEPVEALLRAPDSLAGILNGLPTFTATRPRIFGVA